MALSAMQKHRLIQYLILGGIFLFLWEGYCQAQTTDYLSELYQQNRILELQELLKQNKISHPDWKQFVQALFITEADSALPQFMRLYQRTDDSQLKTIIRERIANFYYARGYYETAQRISTDDLFLQRIISLQQPTSRYGVQVAAFSNYQNAIAAQQKYLKYYKNISIVNKQSRGKDLYVVIVGKYKSRDDAEKALPEINKKLNTKGYIVQY